LSRQLINEYRAELDRLRAVTGSTRETNLRPAFARLLRAWGKHDLDLVFVEEHQIRTPQGNLISVDGALLHTLRVPFGYWEAKDEKDDLDAEIAAKFRKGYPKDNIIFSDDRTAVLWQDNGEITRVAMEDTDALYALLTSFFAHERQEIPSQAWDYRLGNRSAIDWVLDQHKERTPRDPTIREKFSTYRFADYKEGMITLLAKVVQVSVDTVAIIDEMRLAER
jgi:hypothetical protein